MKKRVCNCPTHCCHVNVAKTVIRQEVSANHAACVFERATCVDCGAFIGDKIVESTRP